MHPWGKWGRNFVEYGVHAAQAALADAGLRWTDVQLVSGADTIRNGYPGFVAGASIASALGFSGARVSSAYAACASGATAMDVARAQILAGIVDVALVVETTEAQWDAIMDVNVKGVFLCSKAVVPGMIERRRGRIINTASIAGKRGAPRLSAYCASKFAVIGLTQSLAHEVARYDITVNAVCPGWLGTAMWMDVLISPIMERLGKDAQAAFQEHAAANVPLGRPQTPEDIGQAVVYLAQADNVTGVALNVAGGLVMH